MVRRFALLAAFAALACAGPAAAFADSTILVKFASPTGATAKVESLGDQVDGTTLGGVKVVDPQPGESIADALARYQSRPDVVYAEPNRVVHLLALPDPDDTYYADQWALPTISALAGWSIFPGTFAAPVGAPIGIVDTGVDASHPDLASKIASSGRHVSAAAPQEPRPTPGATAPMSPESRARPRTTPPASPGLPSRHRSPPYGSFATTAPAARSPSPPTWPTGSPGRPRMVRR